LIFRHIYDTQYVFSSLIITSQETEDGRPEQEDKR